jgi:hypothetical protein
MKTLIYIDVDTEREKPISISHPDSITLPTTPEESRVMITNDIACVFDVLLELIHIADQSGYGTKKEFATACTKYLNDFMSAEPKKKE